MPRRGACSRCEKPVTLGPGSRPPDSIVCRPCRRIEREPYGGGSVDLSPRACAEQTCGREFRPRSRGRGRPPQTYCSLLCANRSKNRKPEYEGRARDHRGRVIPTPEEYRAKNYKRRTARRAHDVTPAYEAALRTKARHCPLCQVRLISKPHLPASKELDHIIPIVVGGTHTIGNVRIICRKCNQQRPKDGSDYSGPVTLWAQDVEAAPPRQGRARQAKLPKAPEPVKPPHVYVCRYCRVTAEGHPRS